MRDFVLRHVLKGTIRVIPAGRGKLAIIPTRAWPPDEFLARMVEAGGVPGPMPRMDRPGEAGSPQ